MIVTARFIRRGAIFAAAMVAAHFAPPQAAADQYYKFVEVTCAPEIGVFRLQTFGIYNTPSWWLDAIDLFARYDGTDSTLVKEDRRQRLLEDFGIVPLADLREFALECRMEHDRIGIALTRYHEPVASGECGGNDDGTLQVSVDGVVVATLDPSHGGCDTSVTHTVEYSEYGVQHCESTFEGATATIGSSEFASVPTRCRRTKLVPEPLAAGAVPAPHAALGLVRMPAASAH